MGLTSAPRPALRQRRQCGRAVGVQCLDQFAGDFGESALIGVGQPRRQFIQRHPSDLADLEVVVGGTKIPAARIHELREFVRFFKDDVIPHGWEKGRKWLHGDSPIMRAWANQDAPFHHPRPRGQI